MTPPFAGASRTVASVPGIAAHGPRAVCCRREAAVSLPEPGERPLVGIGVRDRLASDLVAVGVEHHELDRAPWEVRELVGDLRREERCVDRRGHAEEPVDLALGAVLEAHHGVGRFGQRRPADEGGRALLSYLVGDRLIRARPSGSITVTGWARRRSASTQSVAVPSDSCSA